MAGHLIYHWKHGWIPLTHAAALSKAHGSPHLADKYVPGASAHHTRVVTHGRSAREIHSTLTPHTHSTEGEVSKLRAGDHATVRGMDQYGRPMTFTGRVSGKPTPVRIKQGPSGAEQPHLAVSMHNGSDASGMGATARGTVYVKRATPPEQAVPSAQGARGTRIRVGDDVSHANDAHSKMRVAEINPTTGKVRVQNSFQSGAQGTWLSPAQLVPYGQGKGEPAPVGRAVNPDRHLSAAALTRSAQHPHGLAPGDQVILSNVGSGGDRFGTYQGLDVNGKPQVRSAVDGRMVVQSVKAEQIRPRARPAATPAASAPASGEARANVEHSGDGTLLHLDRNDTEARAAAKAAGFKWSSNLGSWFLPRNWSEPTRRQKVAQLQSALGHDKVHLEDAGRGVTTTAAEREAEARARAADRATHMDAKAQRLATEADVRFGRAKAIGDMIPFGQPILVGHHSEARHRRDLAKIDTNMRKGIEAHSEAQAAAAAAERARAATAGDSPLARQRRIDRKEAEVRKIDRALKNHELAQKISNAGRDPRRFGVYPSDPSHVEQMQANRAQLVDEIAHDKAQIAAAGHQSIDRANVSAGDVIHYRGRAHVVSKVNQTTVSVPTGYSWDDKVPVNQITRHVKMADLSEASLRSAFMLAKSNAKLRATLLRELNRRGISAADL